MAIPRSIFVGLVVFGLAACSGSEPTPVESTLGEANNEGVPQGRLVVVNDVGDIVTMDPDGSNVVAITEDGGSVRHFQPIWSPTANSIAWALGNSTGSAITISSDDGSERDSIELEEFPFYLSWSPDGERIGALRGGSDGDFEFEIAEVSSLTTTIIDSGAPYYFSWSPDGDAVAVHVGGARLQIFDESAAPTDLGENTSGYLAPSWSPAGIVFLGPDGLMLRPSESEARMLAELTGFANITTNPQGTLVAVQPLSGEPTGVTVGLAAQEFLQSDVVSIVDVETGDVEVASDSISAGSFWSPDGQKLLMLLIASGEGDVDVSVWEDGEARSLATISLPGSLVGNALQFADQYAQSWQMWSPGSDAVVIPAEIDGETGIWVMANDDSDPIKVSDGDWAAWSSR